MATFTEIEKNISKIFVKILNNDLLLSLTLALILIIVGVTLGYENTHKMPITRHKSFLYTLEPHNKLSFMSNWDGPIYIHIAKFGYNKVNFTNFFPLYPIVVSIFNKVISSSLYSALLAAWLSLIGAIFYYIKIIKYFFKVENNTEVMRAALLFIIFPSAVFFLATFTESLFALVSLAGIYYAFQNRYILAGLFGLLATATRPNGVFVVLLIGMILLENRRSFLKVFISMAIGSLGSLSYMTYLYFRYGNPFEFIVTQEKVHGWFQHTLVSQAHNFSPLNIIFFIPVLLSVFYWWKTRKSFSIYSILFLSIPVLGGQFGGFVRYTLMAFPVFLMFYDYLKDKVLLYTLTIMLMSIGWTYLLLQYAGGYIGG